jgi:hypothetical protein
VHPYLVRFVFFLAWHATRGRIPTGRGLWRSYSYPVVVDGSALTKAYGYRYRYGTKDAFAKNKGDYAAAFAMPSEPLEMLNLNGMKTAL